MNIFSIVHDYIDRLIPADGSMKTLLVDKDTIGIISVAYTQTMLLDRGVFLVDPVDNRARRPMPAMRAIVFVRPTTASLKAVGQELEAALYSSYTLCFSNVVSTEQLNALANCDAQELVTRVEECFADFVAVNKDLMIVAPPNAAPVTNVVARTVQGITAACLALKRNPLIRYQKSSSMASRVANELSATMRREAELFDYQARDTVILLLDRADDVVTPLLTPWTYQALLHELVGLDNNRLTLPGQAAEESYVFCQTDDAFFADNMCANWGDLCQNVKTFVDKYKASVNVDRDSAQSMEELKALIAKLPQAKQLSGAVAKHTAVVMHLSETIKARQLLDMSMLEQNMLTESSAGDHWQRVVELSKNPAVPRHDVARLCLIYNLRYEKQAVGSKAEALLSDTPYFMLVRRFREFHGDRDASALFSGVLKSVVSFITGLNNERNILTQHEPQLKKHIAAMVQGKLDTAEFPYVVAPTNPSFRPKEAVVFVSGGVTFEEAAVVNSINASPAVVGDIQVLLASTSIVNSAAFFKQLDPEQ
jgi:hypothetical protein